MSAGPQHRFLPDGRRLHLSHGPIDLILQADGENAAVQAAYARAVERFEGVLAGLAAELPQLRQAVSGRNCPMAGDIARRMWHSAQRFMPQFVTPMAAVAGAVAEAVLSVMVPAPGITRAYANNGGDIALYLAPEAAPWRLGVVVDPAAPASPGTLTIQPGDPARGVATSGAKGRSHSLGIADSVTVLAADAPTADVAATLLGNAVDLPDHPAISRLPACMLYPDSDLGERPVTTAVGTLTETEIAQALDRGEAAADVMLQRKIIFGAVLVLRGTVRIVGAMSLAPAPSTSRTLLHA